MTIASDLLRQHIQTLVDDNAQWQTLISDDLLWELVYAPALGHPARLTGREEVMRHVNWFRGAVENFRFFDIRVYAFADPEAAVAEFKAEGLMLTYRRVCAQKGLPAWKIPTKKLRAASIRGMMALGLPKISSLVERIFIPTFSVSTLWSTSANA